jgi:hypothetical protein
MNLYYKYFSPLKLITFIKFYLWNDIQHFYKIPKPSKIIRSKLNSVENTKGSFSYIKMSSSAKDMQALVDPLVKNLIQI